MNTDYFEALTSSQYCLQPGYIFVPDQNISISTVLGSGVSVCIYNRKKRIGGMDYYIRGCQRRKRKEGGVQYQHQ